MSLKRGYESILASNIEALNLQIEDLADAGPGVSAVNGSTPAEEVEALSRQRSELCAHLKQFRSMGEAEWRIQLSRRQMDFE